MAVLRVCLAVALILLGGGFGARAEDAARHTQRVVSTGRCWWSIPACTRG